MATVRVWGASAGQLHHRCFEQSAKKIGLSQETHPSTFSSSWKVKSSRNAHTHRWSLLQPLRIGVHKVFRYLSQVLVPLGLRKKSLSLPADLAGFRLLDNSLNLNSFSHTPSEATLDVCEPHVSTHFCVGV